MSSTLTATSLQFQHVGPFDFEALTGSCLAVTGPSGAGKSLLLRMIADLLPHQGNCHLDGRTCDTMPAPEWRSLVRYSGSEPGWWAPTVAAHFRDIAAMKAATESLRLSPDLFDAAPERLSTGERQRFALLRAIEQRPRFLLLDEPTSALDHETTLQVEALVSGLMADDIGIILVSHAADQVERLAQATFAIERPA